MKRGTLAEMDHELFVSASEIEKKMDGKRRENK